MRIRTNNVVRRWMAWSCLLVLSVVCFAQPRTTTHAETNTPEVFPPSTYYRPSYNNFVVEGSDPINVIVYGHSEVDVQNVRDFLAIGGATDGTVWYTNCAIPAQWSPLDGGTTQGNSASDATTGCPSDETGTHRNHTRYWSYSDPANNIYTVYIAASNELDHIFRDNPCAPAHCLLDFNDAADQVATQIRRGADISGWATARYDLSDVPVFQSTQANSAQPSTDGTVRVLCLDSQVNGYCDDLPAQRPLTIQVDQQAIGNRLVAGSLYHFETTVGYSDRDRSAASLDYRFVYTAIGGAQSPLIKPSQRIRGVGTDQTIWGGDIQIPQDAVSQPISMEIAVCDSAGICWKRFNIPYTIISSADCTASPSCIPPPTPEPTRSTPEGTWDYVLTYRDSSGTLGRGTIIIGPARTDGTHDATCTFLTPTGADEGCRIYTSGDPFNWRTTLGITSNGVANFAMVTHNSYYFAQRLYHFDTGGLDGTTVVTGGRSETNANDIITMTRR